MLCEECNQRPAEVTVTTIVDGESTTRHLCRECVKKYQTGDLAGVLAALLASVSSKEEDAPDTACPRCGMKLSELHKTGMLGCPGCYDAFRDELRGLLTRMQGRAQHAGRRPPEDEKEQARQEKMQSLRSQMEQAVAEERFEDAAALRDALKTLREETEGKEHV